MPEMYRFRSMDSLLRNYKELESQTIYFATPSQLNDPIEGLRNIFWRGDTPAWNNLIKHYINQMVVSVTLIALKGEKENSIDFSSIGVTAQSYTDNPNTRNKTNEIYVKIRSHEKLSKLLDFLGSTDRKIYKNELQFLLYMLHAHIFREVCRALEDILGEIDPADAEADKDLNGMPGFELWLQMEKEGIDEDLLNILFETAASLTLQNNTLIELKDKNPPEKNKRFLIMDFPFKYVESIEDLVFPRWYAACFMSDYRNSAVWGHYAENHSGCCLIFDINEEENSKNLLLHDISSIGTGGYGYDTRPYTFHKVDYSGGHGEIDFFRSLGNLAIRYLEDIWYQDIDGNISICAQDIFDDEEKFRQRYWKSFFRDLKIKTKDWGYENEYRLIMFSMAFDRELAENRKPTYPFSALKGIIFGIKTSKKDIIDTLEVIKKKCSKENRENFEVYQAHYCRKSKNIKRQRMKIFEKFIFADN